MVCESCGEKKKKTCDNNFPKAVVEITNPDTLVLLRKVTVPASMGDEKSNPPKVGAYCNVLLYYEATGMAYLYSSDGIPTLLTISVEELQDLIEQVADLEEEIDSKQDKLTAGDNITIEGNVISAVAATYVAGDNIQINGDVISATDTIYDDTEVKSDITNLQNEVQGIEEKIPSAASSTNQLADKNFVNSSIATNTANFIGTFNSVAELEAYSGPLTNNDYAFVVVTDAVGNTAYDRYKYNAGTSEWLFEYELNNSSFTASQWAAINSGITSGDVTKLNNLADIQTIGANLTLTNGELSATDTTYTAGTNVQISNQNVISATDTTYTAGNNVQISAQNVISATDTTYTAGSGLNLTGTQFSADTSVLATQNDLTTGLDTKQNTLTAGNNIQISGDTISATDTTYTAGSGLDLTGTEFSIDTSTVATQTDLANGLADKQDTLTAGSNVQINNSTISATDTTYSDFSGATSSTAGTAGLVPAPASGEIDKYLKSDGTWATVSQYSLPAATASTLGGVKIGDNLAMDANDVLSVTNTGKAKELTTADYNYPTNNPSSVALWRLEPGVYYSRSNVNIARDNLYSNNNSFVAVVGGFESSRKNVLSIEQPFNRNATIIQETLDATTGSLVTNSMSTTLLTSAFIVNSLTSTSTTSALSANQGKVLKDLIDGIVDFTGTDGTSAGTHGLVPAPATTDAGKFLKADGTWDDAGSPINVVQTTGTSTTDVMSQNAVTSMVFADPSTKQKIQIGSGASASRGNAISIGADSSAAGDNSVAIGRRAEVTSARDYAVALGADSTAGGVCSLALPGSTASNQGVIQVGLNRSSGWASYGYNNSAYRLLTGLYDPQSAHDAANKGYVDTSITTAISSITGVEFEVVQTLPATGDAGTIYLVPNQGTTPNIYDEYIYVNNAFEKIGTTEIDLSNYVTTTDLSTALADYTTTANLATVATTGDYIDLTNTPAVFTTAEWNALWA